MIEIKSLEKNKEVIWFSMGGETYCITNCSVEVTGINTFIRSYSFLRSIKLPPGWDRDLGTSSVNHLLEVGNLSIYDKKLGILNSIGNTSINVKLLNGNYSKVSFLTGLEPVTIKDNPLPYVSSLNGSIYRYFDCLNPLLKIKELRGSLPDTIHLYNESWGLSDTICGLIKNYSIPLNLTKVAGEPDLNELFSRFEY